MPIKLGGGNVTRSGSPSATFPQGSTLTWNITLSNVGYLRGLLLSVQPQNATLKTNAIQVVANGTYYEVN